MFDNIGKNPDEEAARRGVASMLISVGLFAAAAGAIAFATYQVAGDEIIDVLEDMDMVEVDMTAEDDLAPPPPPPPPPAAGPEEEEEEEEEEEPEDQPDEMSEEVTELEEEVKEEVKAQEVPKGVEGGQEGGVEGGVVGGVVGGVEGGVLGGTGTGIKTFHHTELGTPRKRVQPQYPTAAKEMDLGEVRCRARLFIDETGRPYQVMVESCPKVFHRNTKEALLKWRWYPPRDGRKKVKAQTVIAVRFLIPR